MANTVKVEVTWVEEVPSRFQPKPSAYDAVADQVRESGKIARITSTEQAYSRLATRLRERYQDLGVSSRTVEENGKKSFFVYLEPGQALALEGGKAKALGKGTA